MILWATKEKLDTRSGVACHAHRYVLEFISHEIGIDISWTLQGLFKDDGEWHSLHHDDRGVSITSHWAWGGEHVYYDAPHCMFSLGFLHFHWNDWNCKKCRP
jgi:hypothetical protein